MIFSDFVTQLYTKCQADYVISSSFESIRFGTYTYDAWDDSRRENVHIARRTFLASWQPKMYLFQKLIYSLTNAPLCTRVEINTLTENIDLETYFERKCPGAQLNQPMLKIVYIPSGKSYIKGLDTLPDWLREYEKPGAEAALKMAATHFLKVFHISGDPNENTYARTIIFTSEFGCTFLDKMYTLYMLFLDINLEQPNTTISDDQKGLLELLTAIFTKLYANEDYTPALEAFLTRYHAYCGKSLLDYTAFKQSLEKTLYIKQTTELDQNITNLQQSIERYTEELQRLYANLSEAQYKKVSFKGGLVDFTPFFDFIEKSPEMCILRATTDSVTIRVDTVLKYFDVQHYNILKKNTGGYLYDSSDFVNWLIQQLFETQRYVLKIQGVYKMAKNSTYTNGFEVQAIAQPAYFTECPNPHLYFFNCWGQSKSAFYKAITEQSYDVAALQLIAATQQLTLADSTVFIRFRRVLRGDEGNIPKQNIHVIDTQTNQVMSIIDLEQYYKEQIKNVPA